MGAWLRSWGLMVVELVLMVALGIEAAPQEHLVKKLLDQPDVSFKQYAGHVEIGDKPGKALFYYFVEAEADPDQQPLTLWLNGGPGCSSIGGGAFSELGPFFVGGDLKLKINNDSWNKASNLLFVDSPAGVGFSYSHLEEDTIFDDKKTADDMYTFLLRWYEKYPEFKSRDLFLAGESYAGHFIPQLANLLLDHNSKSTGFKFPVKAILLGNPALKFDVDTAATYMYLWSHGVVSDLTFRSIMKHCHFAHFTNTPPHYNTSKECTQAIEQALTLTVEYIFQYDVLTDMCYMKRVAQSIMAKQPMTLMSEGVDVCIDNELIGYFNNFGNGDREDEVKSTLNVDPTIKMDTWSLCSDMKYNERDLEKNIVPDLKRILEHKIPIWIYSGDQDAVVPFIGTQILLREIAKDMNFKLELDYSFWFINDQVAGWTKRYADLLTFAVVRGAGHMVPYTQPERALDLFTTFIKGRTLNIQLPAIKDPSGI